jgi:hypothetical protein
MLAYFPKAYSDEILYSLIARYSIHTGQENNQKAVIEDVFGKRTAVAIPDMPCNLNIFSERVFFVWRVSVSDLISVYTLANFYLPFLSKAQATKIIKSMKSEYGGNIHTRAGITASSIAVNQCFRYCPVCTKEQQKKLGETYWKRQHQLPCVNICLEHSCELIDSNVPFYSIQKHHFQAAETITKAKQVKTVLLCKQEQRLISFCYALLGAQSISQYSMNQWTIFYRKVALETNCLKGKLVDHTLIFIKLSSDWKGTQFEQYLPIEEDNSWLVKIFRKHRSSFHPIRHLMVWCSFLQDESLNDIFSIVAKLPSKSNNADSKVFIATQKTEKSTEKQREAWLKLLTDNPDVGIKALRKLPTGASLYAWFFRHDRDWLQDNSPAPKRTHLKRYKKDYYQWDEENIAFLNRVLPELANLKKRKRASRLFFIKQLPKANSVEKHLVDLPKTSKWLDENQEDHVAFRKFRLRLALKVLSDQNLPVQAWRLLRLASIRKEYITQEIDEYIHSLVFENQSVA